MRRSPALATALLGILLLVSGCGGDDGEAQERPAPTPSPSPSQSLVGLPATGTFAGTLVAVGGPAGATPRTVRGEVRLVSLTDRSVTRTQVDSGGEFQIMLAPGRYRLEGTSPDVNDGDTVCRTAPPITVLEADEVVQARIVCPVK